MACANRIVDEPLFILPGIDVIFGIDSRSRLPK